jgi:sucrose-6-phosphate hydrolase SacC (GH32 family)
MPDFTSTDRPSDDLILNYHLMHPGGESAPGDPNPAFYLDDVYHLHYILTHQWQGERANSFVHVTSPDMLHWTWQPTTLQPALTGHNMYSGTGFLTKEGQPAAVYHGRGPDLNMIAVAKDRSLSAWEQPYPISVKNPDGSDAEITHWDPDCFLIGDTYYAISGGRQQPLMKSNDLRSWTLVGDFLRREMPDVALGEDISCPNFFELDGKWVLVCISHPLGCRYYIGEWDAEAEQFVPLTHARLNWRRDDQPVWGVRQRTDYFAPESLLTGDGRRVLWAWIRSPHLLNKTIQALPRELSLPPDGILRMKPIRELEGLRYGHQSLGPATLGSPVREYAAPVPAVEPPFLQHLADLDGDGYEIKVTIPRTDAERKIVGLTLFSDGRGAGLPILLRPETGTLRVGTTDAPFSVADLPPGEDVTLRIFVDKYLVEVFANDRQAVLSSYTEERATGLDAYTVGAPTRLSALDIWKLRPTNQGFLDAMRSRIWEPRTS